MDTTRDYGVGTRGTKRVNKIQAKKTFLVVAQHRILPTIIVKEKERKKDERHHH